MTVKKSKSKEITKATVKVKEGKVGVYTKSVKENIE